MDNVINIYQGTYLVPNIGFFNKKCDGMLFTQEFKDHDCIEDDDAEYSFPGFKQQGKANWAQVF